LRRFMNKWFVIALFLLLQIAAFGYVILSGSLVSVFVSASLYGISFFVALWVISRKGESAYKLVWVFWILLFPIFGGAIYILLNGRFSKRSFVKRARKSEEDVKLYLRQSALPTMQREELAHAVQGMRGNRLTEIRYLDEYVRYPAFHHTAATFLPSGEETIRALCKALEMAERYIFLEYFIIEEGILWDSVLEILERKVKEGVTVRVIYDDLGCFLHLPKRYDKILKKKGIETAVFNPFISVLTIEQNNRDHRKIAVIDGKTAFTGGVNLADEYINAVEKFGHWKDAAVMLEGGGAWSLTVMFLEMWKLCHRASEKENVFSFLPERMPAIPEDGVIIPYADSPLDHENVGEQVYLQMIQNAKDYVYITTPYLIIDDKILSALTLAAKSGVDVRIVTPKKWDKRVVHLVTRSYYGELCAAGVKIYEYTPGFIHAKTVVSDDEIAVVGSTNFDYRSFYLHFECGVFLCGSRSVGAVKENFLSVLERSEKVAPKEEREKFFVRLRNACFRLLAPWL